MLRGLVTIASALSLVLCVGTVVLWVRSYHAADVWQAQRYKSYDLRSRRGILTCEIASRYAFEETYGFDPSAKYSRKDWPIAFSPDWEFRHDAGYHPRSSAGEHQFGLAVEEPRSRSGAGDLGIFGGTEVKISYARFPCWLATVAFGILPLLWIRTRARRLSQAGGGHCLCCGYDLRASKDRCPECGTPIPLKVEATA